MTLDVWLVARLSAELQEAMAGARIQSVQGDATGLRLGCYRRGAASTLWATFGTGSPLLAIHPDMVSANENVVAGWAGGVAPLLRGSTVESVHAVPDDRVVFLDVVSRSPFGVPSRHRVVYELEPNKANILLLRPVDDDRWQILAAAKEIEGAEGARSVVVGETYALPPPRRRDLDRDAFLALVRDADAKEDRALVRALGRFDPTCTSPLAREAVERAQAHDDDSAAHGTRLLAQWDALRAEVEDRARDTHAPVYAWPAADGYANVHLVRLGWPPGSVESLPSVSAACAAQQDADARRRGAPATASIVKRLQTMLSRCDTEAASLERARRQATDADQLRFAGEAIYAYLAQIPERASTFTTPEGLVIALDPALTAKENAASYFRRFKKARSGLPRIAERLNVLERNREYWEGLLWEAERVRDAAPDDAVALTEEIASAIGLRRGSKPNVSRKRVPPRSVALEDGATALVGRSPKDNERVTFTLGAPDDWWFHARGIPGAHVILKLADPRGVPSDEQIVGAAALAAGQSRAAQAQSVDVDYTQRKHVRKQGGGRVGLVWYTDFKTVRVTPRTL